MRARLIDGFGKIYARRANQLGYDNALRAVDDEGAVLGHQREIAHEHFGFLDFMGIAVGQANRNLQRRGIGCIALLALFHRVFRLVVQRIIRKFQNQAFAVIGDRRNVRQNLPKAFLQKGLVRILLHLNQIGYCQRLFNAGKTHACAFAHLHRMNHTFNHPYLYLQRRRHRRGRLPIDNECTAKVIFVINLQLSSRKHPEFEMFLCSFGKFNSRKRTFVHINSI